MSKRKCIFAVCAALLTLGVFLGCNRTGTSGTGTQRQRLDVVLHVDQFDMGPVFRDFSRRYPHIDVNFEQGQGVDTGVYTSVMADPGVGGVFLLGSGAARIMPLANAGLLQDLTDIYTQRGWDRRVDASTMDIIKRISDGRLYEVSNGKDIFVIKYWMDDFERFGVQVPNTYQEFWQVLERIRAQGQVPVVVGAGFGGAGAGHWMSYFWQTIAGRELVEEMLYGDVPWTHPLSVEAAREYQRLIYGDFLNPDALALDFAEGASIFVTRRGNFPIHLTILAFLDRFANEVDLSGVGQFIIPARNPANTMPVAGLAQTWVVANLSSQKEAAYEFLDYILSPEYTQTLAGIPGGWNNGTGASIIEDIGSLNIQEEYIRDALVSLRDGAAFNVSPYIPGTMRPVYVASMQQMFGRALDAEGFMRNMQAAKEEYFASIR